MNQTTSRKSDGESGRDSLPAMEFDDIGAPGAYVLREAGLLVRVPIEGVHPGHNPLLTVSGRQPVVVSQVSEDPWIPISKAR